MWNFIHENCANWVDNSPSNPFWHSRARLHYGWIPRNSNPSSFLAGSSRSASPEELNNHGWIHGPFRTVLIFVSRWRWWLSYALLFFCSQTNLSGASVCVCGCMWVSHLWLTSDIPDRQSGRMFIYTIFHHSSLLSDVCRSGREKLSSVAKRSLHCAVTVVFKSEHCLPLRVICYFQGVICYSQGVICYPQGEIYYREGSPWKSLWHAFHRLRTTDWLNNLFIRDNDE